MDHRVHRMGNRIKGLAALFLVITLVFLSLNIVPIAQAKTTAGNLDHPPIALPPAQASPTPLAHWKFDEGSGTTTADASGNGHTGTLQGGAAWANGVSGKAVDLNGSTAYVSIPDGAGLDGMTELTIDAWVYLRSYPVSDVGVNIVNKFGPGGFQDDSYQFGVVGENGWGGTYKRRLFLYVTQGTSDGTSLVRYSAATVPLNAWTYVKATWKTPGEMHLYINGVESSGDYGGNNQNTNPINDNAQAVWIGRNPIGGRFLTPWLTKLRYITRWCHH